MQKGLFNKYTVTKNEEPTDPNAQYFVLRLDTDPIAREVARQYAQKVSAVNHRLSVQLEEQLDYCEKAAQENLPGVLTLTNEYEE